LCDALVEHDLGGTCNGCSQEGCGPASGPCGGSGYIRWLCYATHEETCSSG
jgi:hypothetical protein